MTDEEKGKRLAEVRKSLSNEYHYTSLTAGCSLTNVSAMLKDIRFLLKEVDALRWAVGLCVTASLSSFACAGCGRIIAPDGREATYAILAGSIDSPWHKFCAERALDEVKQLRAEVKRLRMELKRRYLTKGDSSAN